MDRSRIQIAITLTALALAPACAGGTDAPQDATGVRVSFALCAGDDVCPGDGDGDPTDPGGDPTDPGITSVDCGVLMIRDVRLDGSAPFDERIWEPIDLFDPATSAINLLDVQEGSYDRVRFKVEPLEGFVPGPSGRKVSMFFCGEADGVVWEYRDDVYETIELRTGAPIEVRPDELATLAVQLDSSGWFSGVDVAALEVASDGIVYLDEEHNKDTREEIRDRIRASIDLVRLD